ncbi:hypothetical protein HZB94_03995 [Candidatus Falkowbacteria bacterium]|nr:hypothetical protein [Candidatus Falkowbacteria bacterium]
MKNKIKIAILVLFLIAPFVCSAQENQSKDVQPLKEAFIKYKQVGWQTYEFDVLTNLPETNGLTYEWLVNNAETFHTSKLRYFFPMGKQVVRVKVMDQYGNSRSDTMELEILFWSLKNNWFWWAVYLVVILMIFYYWAAKIIYLFNRRRVSREARYFLDLLDEHGWVERIIQLRNQKNKKSRKQKTRKQYKG